MRKAGQAADRFPAAYGTTEAASGHQVRQRDASDALGSA